MNFGAFAAGVANQGTKILEDKEDQAFKLKLQNAQIEAQVQAATVAEQRKSVNGETAAHLNNALGMLNPSSGGLSGADTEARMGMLRSNNTLAGRTGRGGVKYNRQELIAAVLENPVAYNDLTATAKADIFPDLQKSGFKRLDKALPGDLQVRADNSLSGLDAIERVNIKLKQGGNDFAQLYAPGQVGAKQLRADLVEITDVIKRIRSGAATNGNEEGMYEAQVMQNSITSLLDDLLDGTVDPKNIEYSLNTIYKPYLTRMSNMQERRRTEVVEQKKKEEIVDKSKGFEGMSTDEKMTLLLERRAAKKKAAEKQATKAP